MQPPPPSERVSRKEQPAACPFCEAHVPRPRKMPEVEDAVAGRCTCGAIYVADLTGKSGGQCLVHALTLLCDGDVDRAMGLSSGEDYQLEKLPYRPRTHALERQPIKRGGFGRTKLWFVRAISTT